MRLTLNAEAEQLLQTITLSIHACVYTGMRLTKQQLTKTRDPARVAPAPGADDDQEGSNPPDSTQEAGSTQLSQLGCAGCRLCQATQGKWE